MIEELAKQVDGWKLTALAMREAAIFWGRDGRSRQRAIEDMYFDAAMFGRFSTPEQFVASDAHK